MRATVGRVASAYVALLLIHLRFPEAGSLKAKRKERSLTSFLDAGGIG